MKFPYGISDFELLMTEGHYYCDRTDRIPLLEQAGYQLMFLRPRRFGKSLLLNMLANYYDLKKADKFEELFGTLKIGQNPTKKHNQYFVMTWDFSAILPMGNTVELKETLYAYLNARMLRFLQKYQDYLPKHHNIELENDALASFEKVLGLISHTGKKLYLFIDEYDNFANEVMATKVNENQRYAELVYGEGLLKTVFKNIKIAATGNGLERVFITGVSPVVLADMSSGYNVVVSIYRRGEFNDLCGFHESEIQIVLKQLAQEKHFSDAQVFLMMEIMKKFYNGYSFDEDQDNLIYNPTLALYFLEHLQRTGKYPKNLLDHNLAMDRSRLNYIARLPHGHEVIENALDEARDLFVPKIHDRFGVEDMLNHEQQENELASLLYYLGVLTLNGSTPLGEVKLRIPNLVIKSLYVEKLRQILLPDIYPQTFSTIYRDFVNSSRLQPLCEFIEQRFSVFSNRDYRWSGEMALKTAFLMFLFDDRLYIIDSEPELNRRYADLVMIIRPDARQYNIFDFLFEFKFLSLKELNLSSEQIKQLSNEQLSNLTQTQTAFSQATQQLNHYRQILEQEYRDVLRLKMFAVVAFGFERIVWVEIVSL